MYEMPTMDANIIYRKHELKKKIIRIRMKMRKGYLEMEGSGWGGEGE